jgi:Glycosyl transferase family 2
MTAFLVIDALVVLGWVLFCAALPFALRKLPHVRADLSTPLPEGRLSVVIPARDEETLLPRCLDSLRAQEPALGEIIVVDDGSRDATARVAEERGARVIPAGARPPGWAGKPWAVHVGANAAGGEWLLFVDADAVLAPGCVRAALAAAGQEAADLLSLLPAWRCSSALEALVQPMLFLILLVQFDVQKINDPRSPVAAAWGGFMLFRRTAYEAIGGHAAVKGDVFEDLMIARRVKRDGLRLRLLAAPELLEAARPLSARRIWDDGCRAALGETGRSVFLPLLAAAALIVLFVGPYLLAPFGWLFVFLAGLHAASAILIRVQTGRALGLDYRLAWLQPIGALFFATVLLWASAATLVGGAAIRWGDRQYKA